MNLAYRDVRLNLFRFLITCLGLGLLMTVVLAMVGICNGLVADALNIFKAPQADIWVVEADTQGTFAEARLHGVVPAGSITHQTIEAPYRGAALRLYVIGYKRGRSGGPQTIVQGRGLEASHFERVADINSGLTPGGVCDAGRGADGAPVETSGGPDPSGAGGYRDQIGGGQGAQADRHVKADRCARPFDHWAGRAAIAGAGADAGHGVDPDGQGLLPAPGAAGACQCAGADRDHSGGLRRRLGARRAGGDLRRLRLDKIGFIFQAHNLLPFLNAVDNVALVQQLAGRTRDQAQNRALTNSPRIILADEPTAALDSKRAGIVMDLLRKLAAEQDACIIAVTHDEKIMDRLFHLRDGRLEDDKEDTR